MKLVGMCTFPLNRPVSCRIGSVEFHSKHYTARTNSQKSIFLFILVCFNGCLLFISFKCLIHFD
jgi:hypothetical protein